MSKLWLVWLAESAAACLLLAGEAHAQRAAAVPVAAAAPVGAAGPVAAAALAAPVQAELLDMAARAGVIFAGHVLAVEPHEGFVDVHFRVDEPVRGCSRAGIYVLREWSGLWDRSGGARYRAGEWLLMLLTARGPAGMSAPVGGDEGRIALAATVAGPLADAQGRATAEDGSVAGDVTTKSVDLRWVQAQTVRGVSAAAAERQGADFAAQGWSGPVSPLSPLVPVASASFGAAPPSAATVLALLRSAATVKPSPAAHEGR